MCQKMNRSALKLVLGMLSIGFLSSISFAGVGEDQLLREAAARGNLKQVQRWLEKGANPTLPGSDGKTAFDRAKENGYAEVAEYLAQMSPLVQRITSMLANNEDLSQAIQDDWSVFHFAAQENDTAAIKLLLDKKVAVDIPTENGLTPLHIAAARGNLAAVKLLLSNNADASKKDGNGTTAMRLASSGGHSEIVQLMLDNSPHLKGLSNFIETMAKIFSLKDSMNHKLGKFSSLQKKSIAENLQSQILKEEARIKEKTVDLGEWTIRDIGEPKQRRSLTQTGKQLSDEIESEMNRKLIEGMFGGSGETFSDLIVWTANARSKLDKCSKCWTQPFTYYPVLLQNASGLGVSTGKKTSKIIPNFVYSLSTYTTVKKTAEKLTVGAPVQIKGKIISMNITDETDKANAKIELEIELDTKTLEKSLKKKK
jgi:ankyrin repeat protein